MSVGTSPWCWGTNFGALGIDSLEFENILRWGANSGALGTNPSAHSSQLPAQQLLDLPA